MSSDGAKVRRTLTFRYAQNPQHLIVRNVTTWTRIALPLRIEHVDLP